jgi:hypothetical protein
MRIHNAWLHCDSLINSAHSSKSKVRPRIAPGPDLTGARGTSARAAISFHVVTTTAAVQLLAAAPHHAPFRPSRGERQVFPR